MNWEKGCLTLNFENSHLECHELVVGFGGPGINLYALLQCYDKELDFFIFHCKIIKIIFIFKFILMFKKNSLMYIPWDKIVTTSIAHLCMQGIKIRADDGPSGSKLIGWTLNWLNFELTYLEVDTALQFAHIDPAVPSVIL